MAVIKLTIQPDKASLEATVNEINNKLKEIKGLQIRVDNSGAQAAQSLASNLQKASSAAMEYDHRLDDVRKAAQALQGEFGKLQRIVGTTFSDETKQFTQAVAEFGKAGEEVRRVAIAFDEAGEATHTLVSGTEDVAAASKRAAREAAQAAKEKEKSDRQIAQTAKELDREMEKSRKERNAQFQKFEQEQREYEAKQHKKRVEEIQFEAEEQRKQKQAELEVEKQIAAEIEAVHEEQRKRMAAFQQEQAQWTAQNEAEQHRKNAEAIIFEAQAQQELREEQERATDKAVSLRREYAQLTMQIRAAKETSEKDFITGSEYSSLAAEAAQALQAVHNLNSGSEDFGKTVDDLSKKLKDLRARFAETKTYVKDYGKTEEQAKAEAEALRKSYADFIRQIDQLKEKYPAGTFDEIRQSAVEAQESLQNGGMAFSDLREVVEKSAESLRHLKTELSETRQNTDMLDDSVAKAEKTSVDLERQYSNLIRQIQTLKAQYPEGTFDDIEREARESRDELRKLDSTSETYVEDVNRLGVALKNHQRDLANVRSETQKLDKVTESFWMNIQKFARWYIGGNIVTKVIGSLREALATMKEVDTELANIQKVTDRTDQQMQKTAEAAYKVASAYGVAAQDYLESVAEFAKAGFGDQSEQLAEIATKTQLVGDVTSTIANKFLIASNAAWKMNGDIATLNKTLDAANIIENNYATSIEKLAAGMPIVSSIAAQAGMTFEETIAALGTITAVTQETGTKAATALRALILNILGAVGEYEDGIEITEESVKSLDGILQVYAKDALAAAKAAGTVINPMEAIAALAKASEEGLVNQAELFDVLSSLGGKLRTNQLTALVQNFDMMQEMLDKTTQSAGSADKEIGVMLDTWEAKTNILKNTWTEFIAKTIDSDFIKGLLDISTALVDFADNAGLAAAAVGGLMLVFKGKEVVGAINDVKKVFQDLGGALKGVTTSMTATTTAAGLMVTALSVAIMIHKSVQEARAEAIEKAVQEAGEIKDLADRYEDLSTKINDENLSRDELVTLLKKSTEKYSEELENIENINELRSAGIKLIDEETKARAKQYTLENAGAYRRSQKYLESDSAVSVAYMGGSREMGAKEALEWLEHMIELYSALENPTSLQIAQLETLSNEYKTVKKDIEDATTTVDAYETALSILDGTYERIEESGSGAAGRIKNLNTELDDEIPKVKTLAERLAEASEAANAYDTAISEVKTALDEFGAGSIEVYNAMVKLEAAIPGSTEKLYDFSTATWKIDAGLIESKGDLLNFIDTQKQLEFSSAISQLESVAAAYWDIAGAAVAAMNAQAAQQMASVLAFTGTGASQSHYDIAQTQLAGVKAQKAEWDAYIATLRARSGYRDSGGSGSTASSADPELVRLQKIVELRKAELSFLEASGKSEDEINAKRKEIQAALHDQAEYMRSIGSDEADILALSTEWWNIQKQITEEIKEASAELDRLKAIVSYEKQELSFLEASGKSLEEINAKRKEIQASLHDQAEYMRGVLATMDDTNSTEAERKAYEEEILALSVEWWNLQNQINDDLAKAEEERIRKLEEEKKLQQEMFDNLKSIVDDYYAKLIEDKEKELTLEERILAVQQAEAALANAQRERTVRYYNAATGQWEWQANAKNVKSAQDALKKAQDDLNKYQREQAWKEFKSAWEYVSEQIKSGAMTFQEAYNYMYQEMKRIQDTYGVDLGGTLEDSIGGFKNLNYGIDGLTQEVANTLGASVGVLDEKLKQYETAVGALKKSFDDAAEKVKNGEITMEDAYSYLRDRAKEIAEKYGIDMTGALNEAIAGMDKTNMSIDELWKAVILNLMKVNSARWHDAGPEERALLHAQNEFLGSMIGATYEAEHGYWYLNGSKLYESQKGVDYSGKLSGWGNYTGSGGGYGGGNTGGGGFGGGVLGGGGGGEDASEGLVLLSSGAIKEVTKTGDGTRKFKLYDGSEYDTLEEAIAANAANAADNKKRQGTIYYGNALGTIFLNQQRWKDPELWAEYSKLAEADPEYAAALKEVEQAVRNGASQSEITAMVNALYTDAGMGYFGSIQGENIATGWVMAGYGNANGEHLLVLNGELYHSQVKPGSLVQDLWGNRAVVAEDGKTLIPLLRAWDENGNPGYVYSATGINNGQPVLSAEDIAAGEKWTAMTDLANSDLGVVDTPSLDNVEIPASADTITNSNVSNVSGDTINIGDISISDEDARKLTVHDLVKLAGGLGSFKG